MWSNAGWLSDDTGWYLNKVSGGGGATFTTLNSSAVAGGGGYSQTINGGSNLPTCCVIIGVAFSGGVAPTGAAIGGTALGTPVAKDNGASSNVYMYAKDVTAGNGDALTFTNSINASLIYISACYVTGLTASQVSATTAVAVYGSDNCRAANPLATTTTLTVPVGGFGIAFLGSFQNHTTDPTAFDWSASNSIFNTAGDTKAIPATTLTGGCSLAHTATSGVGWLPKVFPNLGDMNFSSGLLAITIG